MTVTRRGDSKSPWFDNSLQGAQYKESDAHKHYRAPNAQQKARRWRREAVEIIEEARLLGDELSEIWEE